MRYFLITLLAILGLSQAQAAPQLGISPCVISAQPAALSFSGTSANRRMSSCGETVIIYNNSSSDVFYRLGTSSGTTATTSDLLLPANSFVVLNVGTSQQYIAFISGGSGAVYFVQGTAGN